MKKAFTLLELVFVIVVIGILAIAIIPNTRVNPLQEAAIQLVSHIRYTQHLAVVDDKYNPESIDSGTGLTKWYKERWQLIFSNGTETGDEEAYSIYSDNAGNSTGNVNPSEVARNPENSAQLMSGGFSGAANALNITHNDFIGMKKLNLGYSYGVENVIFVGGCSTARRLAFDHLGRPIQGNLRTTTSAYHAASQRLVVTDCNIILSNVDNNITIIIRPETGYTCIANENNTSQCR